MRLTIILIIVVLSVALAVQNAGVVTLSVFAWRLEASLAVIMVLCIAAGALMAALALTPHIYRRRAEQRKLRRQLAELGHDPMTEREDDLMDQRPPTSTSARN